MSIVNKSKNKPLLASVFGAGKNFLIVIIEEKDQKFYKKIEISTVKKFFQSILSFKSELKAIFLCVTFVRDSEYANSYESSKAIREFLVRHSIPCHFYSMEYFLSFQIRVAANISPDIGDFILLVNIENDKETIFGVYLFTANGYENIRSSTLKEKDLEKLATSVLEMMENSFISKMILFTADKGSDKLLKKFEAALRSNKSFKIGDKLVVIDSKKLVEIECSGKTTAEMSKWFFDRSYVKFYLPPAIPRPIEILGVIANYQKKIISVEHGKVIPYIETAVITKSVQKCIMQQFDGNTYEIFKTIKMDEKCHQRKIILSYESECFPELKIEPIIIPEIEKLPKKLDEFCKSKIPVIGFFDHSSVICVYKNDGYKFLDSWNGVYGNELFINFQHPTPKYGIEAINADKTRMSSVVYDLIKIMAMPAEKIVANEDWKFVITKDSENPVLIEFDNFEEKKKAATPPFLMAMILKEKIKRIKNEMNEEKPKEIGFCFFDKMSKAEMKRVGAGIEEACKLLKIACTFVKI